MKGQGQVILLEGEAGIGKSRLIEETLGAASAQGLRTLLGRSRELETERPFGAIAEALQLRESADPELAVIRELLTGSEALGELRFRIVDLVFDLLERLSQEAPVVLALEDLHWADTSTLLVLDRLGTQAPAMPLLIVGTARPSPRSRELTVALEAIRPKIMRLQPLDLEASLELASGFLHARPGVSLTRKLEAAGGNPLFEAELVAALQEEGAIEVVEGVAEVADRELPPSLRLTILGRLGFLPEGTLEALRVASVLGSSFRVEDLARVIDRSPVELLQALDPALRSAMILEKGDRMVFRHDLVRDAVYEDLPGGVRVGLHREAGRALLATGASPLDAARHVALGASRGDQEAIDVLSEAASQAAPRAPASAAVFLSRALELAPIGSPGRAGILADLALALYGAGRLVEAEARATEALAEPELDDETAVRAAWAAVWGLGGQGRDRDAIAFLSRFLDERQVPVSAHTRLLLTRAQARVVVLDLEGAEADLREGRRLAEGEGDDATRAAVLSSTAFVSYVRGRAQDALAGLDEAVVLAETSGATDEVLGARGIRIGTLTTLDRFDEVLREGRDLALFAERRGLSVLAGRVHVHLASALVIAGKWDEAQAEVETADALFGSRPSEIPAASLASIRGALAFHRNDTRTAESEISLGEELVARRRPVEGSQGLDLTGALLKEAAGQPAEALAVFEELLRTRAEYLYDVPRWAPDAVRVAVALGDQDAASRFVALAASAAAALGTASARSAALRCEGLAAGDYGLLAKSVEVGKGSPRPLARALTLEDAARLCPKLSKAVALLEEALAILDELGADRYARRVRAALRERGVRRGRSPTARAKVGWEALTESEQRVVELVAEGLRNRQIAERLFISIRTVESHISSALTKVGVSSRVELTAAALATRRGEEP